MANHLAHSIQFSIIVFYMSSLIFICISFSHETNSDVTQNESFKDMVILTHYFSLNQPPMNVTLGVFLITFCGFVLVGDFK